MQLRLTYLVMILAASVVPVQAAVECGSLLGAHSDAVLRELLSSWKSSHELSDSNTQLRRQDLLYVIGASLKDLRGKISESQNIRAAAFRLRSIQAMALLRQMRVSINDRYDHNGILSKQTRKISEQFVRIPEAIREAVERSSDVQLQKDLIFSLVDLSIKDEGSMLALADLVKNAQLSREVRFLALIGYSQAASTLSFDLTGSIHGYAKDPRHDHSLWRSLPNSKIMFLPGHVSVSDPQLNAFVRENLQELQKLGVGIKLNEGAIQKNIPFQVLGLADPYFSDEYISYREDSKNIQKMAGIKSER